MSGGAETYVALSGGIGGAKLSLGLAHLLGDRLTVIANTGDDFEHFGLTVSPDVDTALYTLSGVANPETGWGRRDETWSFMEATAALGGPTWFKLGDRDLAVHVERTRRLRAGETLTAITEHFTQAFGIAVRVLPMTDAPVRTMIDCEGGTLAFQDYFVRDQCRPVVRAIRYDGAEQSHVTAAVKAALAAPTLAGIIICPSNPWLSIDPILAVAGMRKALKASGAPIIAVSPIVGGRALKGPTAKIMTELGLRPDAATIAAHYGDLLDGMVVDVADAASVHAIEVDTTATKTVMHTLDDKTALAERCMDFCAQLRTAKPSRALEVSQDATLG